MARTGPDYPIFQGVFAAAPGGAVFVDAGAEVDDFRAIVVEKRASNGTLRWKRRLRGKSKSSSSTFTDMEVTANGDLIAAGSWHNPTASWLVTRLDGHDGTTRWKAEVPSSSDGATSPHEAGVLALSPGGLAVVGGTIVDGASPNEQGHLAVIAYDQDDGAEHWRYGFPTRDDAESVAALVIDAAGDVLMTGYGGGTFVAKLDGATGAEHWRVPVAINQNSAVLRTTHGGDVVLGATSSASVEGGMELVLLDGESGATRWSRRITGPPTGSTTTAWESLSDVLLLPDGDVIASGWLTDEASVGLFTVVRLAAGDGGEVWRHYVFPGAALGLALVPDGRLFVAGATNRPTTCGDGVIAELDPDDGSVRELRLIDGKTRATSCEAPPPCYFPRCPTRQGIDRDSVVGLIALPSGRLIFRGNVSDGRFGKRHGLIGSLRID